MLIFRNYEDVDNNFESLKSQGIDTEEGSYFETDIGINLLIKNNIYVVINVIYEIDNPNADVVEHILLKKIDEDEFLL